MKIVIEYLGKTWIADLNDGIDISIPAKVHDQINCFYAPPFTRTPFIAGDFIGSTSRGGFLNFFNLQINPHGNCTHTESVQHLDHRSPTINALLSLHHFHAYLHTVTPQLNTRGELCISLDLLKDLPVGIDALIIRTAPNSYRKLTANYSGSNPPYIEKKAMDFIVRLNVMHLLVDLPSVDPEEDEGQLIAHKTFWNYPNQLDSQKTITELIYVPDQALDGHYMLNLNPAPIESDASPSRPIIYPLKALK
jgi:kynurenine formamidase